MIHCYCYLLSFVRSHNSCTFFNKRPVSTVFAFVNFLHHIYCFVFLQLSDIIVIPNVFVAVINS